MESGMAMIGTGTPILDVSILSSGLTYCATNWVPVHRIHFKIPLGLSHHIPPTETFLSFLFSLVFSNFLMPCKGGYKHTIQILCFSQWGALNFPLLQSKDTPFSLYIYKSFFFFTFFLFFLFFFLEGHPSGTKAVSAYFRTRVGERFWGFHTSISKIPWVGCLDRFGWWFLLRGKAFSLSPGPSITESRTEGLKTVLQWFDCRVGSQAKLN